MSRIEEHSRREYGLSHLVTLQAETFEPALNRLDSKVELEYVQIGNEVSEIPIPIMDTQLVLIHTIHRGVTGTIARLFLPEPEGLYRTVAPSGNPYQRHPPFRTTRRS